MTAHSAPSAPSMYSRSVLITSAAFFIGGSSRGWRGGTGSGADGHLGDRHDELPPPLPDELVLPDDLVLEVPGQDQQVVGARLPDAVRAADRDARAGQVVALLLGVAVHRVVKEIGADPAVVEERVSLARSAVAGDRLAAPLGVD